MCVNQKDQLIRELPPTGSGSLHRGGSPLQPVQDWNEKRAADRRAALERDRRDREARERRRRQ